MAKRKQTSFEFFCTTLAHKLIGNFQMPPFRLRLTRDPDSRKYYLEAELKDAPVTLTPNFPVGELLNESISVSFRECLAAMGIKKSLSTDSLIEDFLSTVWLRRTGAFFRWCRISKLEKFISSSLDSRSSWHNSRSIWHNLQPSVLGSICVILVLYDVRNDRSWKGHFLISDLFPQKVLRKICAEMRAFAKQ